MLYGTASKGQENITIRSGQNKNITPKDTAYVHELTRNAQEYIHVHIDSAILLLERAKTYSMAISYPDGVGLALTLTGECYARKGDFNQALSITGKALPYIQSAIYKKERMMREWHINVGTYLSRLGKQDSAMHYFQKAIQLSEAASDTLRLVRSYLETGTMWQYDDRFDYAVEYLKKAETLSLKSQNDYYLPVIYANLAIIYNAKDDTISYFHYARKALVIGKEKNDIFVQRSAYTERGLYYLKIQKFTEALKNFTRALEFRDSGNLMSLRTAHWGLGLACLGLNRLREAEIHLLEAYDLIERTTGINKITAGINMSLAQLYRAMGNPGKTYEYMERFAYLRDSLNHVERNKMVDDLETKYRLAEREKELARKDLQLNRQQSFIRNRNIWIAFISVGGIAIVVLLLTTRRSLNRKMHIMQQEEEIKRLKAMMEGGEKERERIAAELHDGIGSLLSAATINLNNLSDEYREIDKNPTFQKADMLVKEISKEVRKTAHNLMPDTLLLHDLTEAIRLYCDYIAKDRDLVIEIQHFGDFNLLNEDYKLSVYRIIQELLQNIIKHAQATSTLVQLHIDESLLSITVEDNGIGYDQHGTFNSGIGLRNIRTRVMQMKGRLSVNTEPGNGTSVYIEVDLIPGG